MKRIRFSIEIDASPAVVWNTLWNDDTYRKWTAVFMEGSYAESDWKEGSRVLFLAPGGSGLISRIDRLIPNELMLFRHQGMIKDGVEDQSSDEVKAWAGAEEIYRLKEINGKTQLELEQDMTESELKYFEEKWPVALQNVKTLAEKK